MVENVGVDAGNPGYIMRVLRPDGRTQQVTTHYVDQDGLVAPYAIYRQMSDLPQALALELTMFVEKLRWIPGFFSDWSQAHEG